MYNPWTPYKKAIHLHTVVIYAHIVLNRFSLHSAVAMPVHIVHTSTVFAMIGVGWWLHTLKCGSTYSVMGQPQTTEVFCGEL